ncbi:hypothetical protein ADP71_40590 [Vitreoscilla sp. C1]|nr:hypothetical protein ADP71_40590 [Vitreoscilla sp. C1]
MFLEYGCRKYWKKQVFLWEVYEVLMSNKMVCWGHLYVFIIEMIKIESILGFYVVCVFQV